MQVMVRTAAQNYRELDDVAVGIQEVLFFVRIKRAEVFMIDEVQFRLNGLVNISN